MAPCAATPGSPMIVRLARTRDSFQAEGVARSAVRIVWDGARKQKR